MPGGKGLKLALWFLLAGVVAGISAGLYVTRNIPEVDSLQFTTPSLMTRIYSRDGQVLQEYGAEKRTLIHFADISPNFIHALLAVEDSDFYHHHGISVRGTIRAALQDLLHGSPGQGGSTLTQQLARQYFLTPEKTISRKIREAILAINIERHYSKDQILEMYSNKVCFGYGYYGVEASSRFYFNKKARDLTIPEAALLAGLIQRPGYYAPLSHPDRALARRNAVLLRMLQTKYLTRSQYEQFVHAPLGLSTGLAENESRAPYVTERIRMYCEEKYGEEALYEKGLQVYTTIDPALQAQAQRAVVDGLHSYTNRHGYKGPRRGNGAPPEYTGSQFEKDGRYWATVQSASAGEVVARLGQTEVTLTPKNWPWAPQLVAGRTFREGDRILLHVTDPGPPPKFELDQEPRAQAALIAMDPHTGEVLALVGGYDFSQSMYNRAIQAMRQTGSAVKPIIYATALGLGRTLADQVIDEPTLFLTGREHADQLCTEGYIPRDFDPDYFGLITYRTALEHSVNIAAVHILNQIGYQRVIDAARRLHITSTLEPYPSMALGAFEISLWELTGAYTALDNNGIWEQPRFMNRIADRDGKTLEEVRSLAQPVFTPEVSYLMIQAMKGVLKVGTAASAADMKGNFAGKTGTTDKYTDGWFIGFNPAILCGVWVGKDDHKSLGNLETGARVALPIWRQFMEKATAGQQDLDWVQPPDIVTVPIDAQTGLRSDAGTACTKVIDEYFLQGTEPQASCGPKDHLRVKLPYFLQRYPITDGLALVIPRSDLQAWLADYPAVISLKGSNALLVSWGGATFTVKLEIGPPREGPVPQAVMPGLPHEGDVACRAVTEYITQDH